MVTRTHVLISEQFNSGVAIGGSTPLLQPPNRVDWASMYDELSWTLSVRGIWDGGTIGAPGNTLPTAFSVGARFQFGQSHTGAFYRFQTARWSNLSEEEIGTKIIEQAAWFGPGQSEPVADPLTGVGDGIIATQATTGYNATTGLFATPITVRRTLRSFPQRVRVALDGLAFTGGTTPRALIGLEVLGRKY